MTTTNTTPKKSSNAPSWLIYLLLAGLTLSFIVNIAMFTMILGSLQQIYRQVGGVVSMHEYITSDIEKHRAEVNKKAPTNNKQPNK